MSSSIYPGDIISHTQMCIEEGGIMLQRGMNFRLCGNTSVILISVRKGSPYADSVLDSGKTLIYEGHDVPKNVHHSPKTVDQVPYTTKGSITQNGKFYKAAEDYKKGNEPEVVKVYEKIKDGIWVFNGIFELVDAWQELSDKRQVYKFKLLVTDKTIDQKQKRIIEMNDLDHNRIIPSAVKIEVYKRDKGKCVTCGSLTNLHYDHILPYSRGGTSLKVENIQLLCARHNLKKRDKIE
ncbi:MAG: HNH endonuclease [Ferruginibacter sp.]